MQVYCDKQKIVTLKAEPNYCNKAIQINFLTSDNIIMSLQKNKQGKQKILPSQKWHPHKLFDDYKPQKF